MAEPVDAASEQAMQAYQKLVDEWANEFPPGELPSSSHPSGRVTLLFPCGKQRMLLTVEYVPLASPEQLKQALDRAMRWKERVQSLNGK